MEMWLRGEKPRPLFFKEWLPACFERRLDFDDWRLGEAILSWILTGPEGKVRLTLSSSELVFQQYFHDSFYLNSPSLLFDQDFDVARSQWFKAEMSEFDGVTGINVHPEAKWDERRYTLPARLHSVSLSLSHNMELAVLVNGEKVISQNCLYDLHHHQLQLSDSSGYCSGVLSAPMPREVNARVDVEASHQAMLGFGGTTIPTAYAELSEAGRRQFWEYVEDYNLRIQRENPIAGELSEEMDNWDDLDDAIPHYYGDSFPNGNISDFSLNREFIQRGGEVWFEYWHFPKWMVRDGETFVDEKGKERPDPVRVDEYARSIVEYCRRAVKETGQPPRIVGIQNENSHPKETYHAMVLTLRQALDKAGFEQVRIHMSDANMLSTDSEWGKLYADGITRAKTFTERADVWEKVDYAATHMYDFQEYFDDPDRFDEPMKQLHSLYGDRPFLSTELCVNSPRYQMRSYRLALLMGQLSHKNLVLLDAVALLYCWTLLNVEQPSYGWTRSLLAIDRESGFSAKPSSHQLRVFGAWSRRIRKGMVRVEVDCDDSDLLITAFVDDQGGQTLVAMNRGNSPVSLNIQGLDMEQFKWMEEVSPYAPSLSRRITDSIECIAIEPGVIRTLTNIPLRSV